MSAKVEAVLQEMQVECDRSSSLIRLIPRVTISRWHDVLETRIKQLETQLDEAREVCIPRVKTWKQNESSTTS